MNHYAIFDSKAEAEAYRPQALSDWLAAHSGADYLEGTMQWGVSREREDGKWLINLGELSDNTGITTEEYSSGWAFKETLVGRWNTVFDGGTIVDHSLWSPTTVDFTIETIDVLEPAAMGSGAFFLTDNVNLGARVFKRNDDRMRIDYTNTIGEIAFFSHSLAVTADETVTIKIESDASGVTFTVNGVVDTITQVCDPDLFFIYRTGAHYTGVSGMNGRTLLRRYTDHADPSNSRLYEFKESSGLVAVDSLGDGSTDGVFNGVPLRLFE